MKKQIIAIAGGGSTHSPGIIRAILDRPEDFPVQEIRLYDVNEEKNDDMYVTIHHMLKTYGYDEVRLVKTEDPKEAFENCDFVFAQIRVGGMKMREVDEKVPLKHGLVGQETCGLGGFSYGMRTMGGFLELVGYIEEHAPDAWILNYTNPESIVAEAVRRQYPNMKIINTCDMTGGIEQVVAENFGYDRKNWIVDYYGLNHFGWYKTIYDTSLERDVLPELLEKIEKDGIEMTPGEEDWKNQEGWKHSYEMVGFMTQNFPDSIPNLYLEYYLYPDVAVANSDPDYTRANEVMDGREKETRELAQSIRANADQKVEFETNEHGEVIVKMAISISQNIKGRYKLIVPNHGAIPNVRPDATVEIPAYLNAKGIEPVSLGDDIPDFHKGLMEAQVAAEKLLVDAFFEKSYGKALQAFTLNQTVPNATVAKKVLDEFIEANEGYWPELY